MICIVKDGILRHMDNLVFQGGTDYFLDFNLIIPLHVFYNLTPLKPSVFLKQTTYSPALGHLLIPFPLSEIVFSPTILSTPPGFLLTFLFKNKLKSLYIVKSSMTYPHL